MTVSNWPTLGLMVTALLFTGCKDDGEAGSGDTLMDTGTDESGAEELGPWEFEDAIGVINSDDDDENGKRDWLEVPFDSDDDMLAWMMPEAAFMGFGADDQVELVLAGADLDRVRVWHNQSVVALGHDVSEVHESYTFTLGGGDESFEFEFDDYNKVYSITVTHLDGDGNEVDSVEVAVRSAPLIINHHLQPAEHVWAVSVSSNSALINAYGDHLGPRFTSVAGNTVNGDVWIQDEVEFGTATAPGDYRADIIIDSIRDRGLDNFPDQIAEPNRFKQTWGNKGSETTFDSFGNLESTPPITVNGVEYPFGRIYYGKTQAEGLNDILAAFLGGQSVQAPVQLNTTWLCVGHVDEFSSFVPDPGSDKGFKALLADVDAAYEFLEALDPAMALPRYDSDHGYATVGDILADDELRAVNEEIRDDEMAVIRGQFQSEFGLDDSDIIGIPTLFEVVGGCGGRVVALMPGMVNLIVANFEGETPKLFIPDPFFRSDLDDVDGDPLMSLFADLMPAGNESIFVDNWYTYHMALGEVHCGTNVTRTPIANWWEVATHLLN